MTEEIASLWAERLWWLLAVVWLVMAFRMKSTKKLETVFERLQHLVPVVLGFWLLFEWPWRGLGEKVPAGSPAAWWTGLAITAGGVAFGIWARMTLGANWSSMVTLKKDHELICVGPYRWVRHPIYTGILTAFVGTAIIRGHLRGWLGFAIVLASFYFKARREERFLQQEFGAGFAEHARHTGMFLPKLI